MSVAITGPKRGKKHRKYGRNKASCEIYRSTGRREKNKMRKVLRHNGAAALAAYKEMLFAKASR